MSGILAKLPVPQEDPNASFGKKSSILGHVPIWETFGKTKDAKQQELLRKIKPDMAAADLKTLFAENMTLTSEGCVAALGAAEDIHPAQYILTILYDAIREDSSLYALFDQHTHMNSPQFTGFIEALLKVMDSRDVYASDTAAYLITAIMAQDSNELNYGLMSNQVVTEILRFSGKFPGDESHAGPPQTKPLGHAAKAELDGSLLAGVLTKKESAGSLSQLGCLDGIANLLKSSNFRKPVWIAEGVSERVLAVPKDAPPALLYKSVFCLWLLSFDQEISVHLPQGSLKDLAVVSRIKDILTVCRAEKVVRLCLSTLRNLLKYKKTSEEIVEKGTLEVVAALEFEKWRDGDLYDDIRDLSHTLATAVKELSSFERYEKELASGELNWGFIHSDKFWQENVSKFEKDNYKAIGDLGKIIIQHENYSPATLAVACHDIGEFAALHPMGKKKVSEFMVKESVMKLMNSLPSGPEIREVRREALLCCQKIMLDKWQAVTASA